MLAWKERDKQCMVSTIVDGIDNGAVEDVFLSQGGPGESSMVFQVSAYLQTFQYTNIGKAAAMMVVLWAICYFLCHVFVKQWHKLKIKTKGELLQ